MALVRNGQTIFQNPGVFTGSVSFRIGNRLKGGLRNRFVGGFDSSFSAYPSGHLGPSAFVLPKSDGAISSFVLSGAEISATNAAAVSAKVMEAVSSMALTVTNAQLDRIVRMIADATAILSSVVAISAAVSVSADGTITITVTNAALGGIFPTGATAAATLSSNVTMGALANMTAEAGGATPLSPEGLAASLLDDSDVETGYSMREALRLILSSAAGKLSGAETTTITIRNVTDDKSRIVATVDSNGNRSSVTYDVSE